MMSPSLSEEAQLLSIYIGESDKWRGRPLYTALLDTLRAEGLAGATVVRGVAGFGAHSHIHTASILRLSEDLPLCIQVIDKPDRISRAIDLIAPMVTEGLIAVEDIHVVKYTHRYLNPLPADKHVEEVMTRDVTTLTTDMPVADAWGKMLETLLKALPVVDAEDRAVGMLTDEDLLERAGVEHRLAVAERMDAELINAEMEKLRQSGLRVAEVMTKPVITAKTDDPINLAAARMAKLRIKRLPVVEEDGKLVGILSRVDILRLVTGKQAKKVTAPIGAARNLRDVMSPQVPAVKKDADLVTVVETLLKGGYHRLIVVDEKNKVIGLISDADVVERIQPAERHGVLAALSGHGRTPASDMTAGQLMSPGALTTRPETSLVEAAHMMLASNRKWLVVVDEKEQPLGLVDRHILLRAMTSG